MISRKDCFKEIPTPQEVKNMKEPPMLMLLYNLGFMILRIVLDNRLNLQKIEKGKGFNKARKDVRNNSGNPVIRDNVRLK